MLNYSNVKNLKIIKYQTSNNQTMKLGKKLSFLIKFDVCIDVGKHHT
jgi:hypothetical protein